MNHVDRRPRRGQNLRRAQRQSNEYVGFVIMGYLVVKRERGEEGCSPFHLATRVPQLNGQRQERIQQILDLLEEGGLVGARTYPRATYYEVTDQGMEWYKRSAKAFFEPFLAMYRGGSDESYERKTTL